MASAITVPRLGWSMEEGIFLGWLKAEGELVESGQPLFSLETEKASQEVEATDSGVLRIAPDGPTAGATVPVGVLLGYLTAQGEEIVFPETGSPATLAAATEPAPLAPVGHGFPLPAASAPANGRGSAVSPRAARTAMAMGIDLARVRGTGRTGRIREQDVLRAASQAGPPIHDRPEPGRTGHFDPPGRTAPLSATRRAIARRMSAGVNEAAPVTLFARAEAGALVRLREELKAESEPAPSFNDLLIKLAAAALREHPALNAQWHDDTLFFPDGIHIALAIETEGGLLAPVIRDVPSLSLAEVAAASRALIAAARVGRLSGEQLQGGTFTITNLGGFGIDAFTPIVNLPQCAILGVGRILLEPAVVEDRIVPQTILPLSLTFDHRVVDGAPAARFLETLRRHLANPASGLERIS